MKTHSLRALGLAAVALLAYGACASTASAVDVNVAIGAPPPPVVETPGPGPYAGAVWIRGHQQWNGYRWVWVPGHWARPAHRGWVWVPGHYNRFGQWREGHWRRP